MSGKAERMKRRRGAAPLGNSFVIAAHTLWAHKLRSALTIFGIVIGIAAVVLIGATLGIIRDIAARSTAQTIGADAYTISRVAASGRLNRRELADKLRRNPELYRREAEALIRRTREDARAAPGLAAVADVKAGNRTFLSATVNGSTPEIQSIRNIVLSSGRFFTEAESRRSAPVIIIGQDLVDELFPTRDPIGRSLRVRGRALEVIGVQQSLGTSFGSPLDRVAYMPLGTFEKIWGSRRSVTVYLQPLPHLPLEESLERSRVALRLLRRLRPAEPDDFDILVPEADRDFLLRVIGIVGVAVVPISSLALLVAGIVVMNMMLVSVTERTREIGVRKAVGASNRDIFAEILFESAILTAVGGAAGLALSFVGALGLGRAFGESVPLSGAYAALALGVSTLIGCGAGFYPAWIASRMPPVEALRYEN